MLPIEIEAAILSEMATQEIFCSIPLVPDGNLYRFSNKNSFNKNCWVVMHSQSYKNETFYIAVFGDWKRRPDSTIWRSGNYSNLARNHKVDFDKKIKASQEKARIEQLLIHQETALNVAIEWEKLSTHGESEYLKKKRVKPHGVRFGNGFLAIPIMDIDGKLWSIQRIFNAPDSSGKYAKRFTKNGRKRACFHTIGCIEGADRILVAEGYATAATLFESTNIPVIVAFDSGNLGPVVSAIKGKYPKIRIVICGDEDCWNLKNANPGRKAAEDAAKLYSCAAIFPDFSGIDPPLLDQYKPTDFNDLFILHSNFIEKGHN